MLKFPCGNGVRTKAVHYNGSCNLWYHTKMYKYDGCRFLKLFAGRKIRTGIVMNAKTPVSLLIKTLA